MQTLLQNPTVGVGSLGTVKLNEIKKKKKKEPVFLLLYGIKKLYLINKFLFN